MTEAGHYSAGFFEEHAAGAHSSASRILPIVNDAVRPRSVIDVGCGVGGWLRVWREELKVERVLGIEGPWVTREVLQIPSEFVRLQDLKEPFGVDGQYDLAMSLEVAEHLPADCGEQFVSCLTALSDVVLFSAAIPGQGGTHHLNERVPEYWAELFDQRGFAPADLVRELVRNDDTVEWWYQQNVVLYVRRSRLPEFPVLQRVCAATDATDLLRIHPTLYFKRLGELTKVRSAFGYLLWRTYSAGTRLLGYWTEWWSSLRRSRRRR